MTTQIAEQFIVGDTVNFHTGEDVFDVEVIAVRGEEVSIADSSGMEIAFYPRESDGKLVSLGSPDHEVMPETITHKQPVKESFYRQLVNLFA